jgi:hypothetical protein
MVNHIPGGMDAELTRLILFVVIFSTEPHSAGVPIGRRMLVTIAHVGVGVPI